MNTVGDIIKYLRKSINVSQHDLANFLGCSREFVSQLERNKRSLPEYYILPMSNFLKHDISKIVKDAHKYKNFEHYLLATKLQESIELRDSLTIDELLKNEIIVNEFDYPKTIILKQYCTALVECVVNSDYEKSINICLGILDISNKEKITKYKPILHYDPRYYSTILLLGGNLKRCSEHTLTKHLLSSTIEFFNEYIFNEHLPQTNIPFFYKKAYVFLLNNYADTLFMLEEYDNSLYYCNKSISFAYENNIFYRVEIFLELKVEILCKLNDYENAKESLIDFKSICRIVSNQEYFDTKLEIFKNNYPKLFE